MNTVIIITIVTCVAMIISVLIKPTIQLKGHTIGLYWILVLLGAATLIAGGLITCQEVIRGLTADTSINPVKILVLFLSMSTLSIFLDEIGFFRYLANYVLKKAKANQKVLFIYLYLIVSVLTVFTSNDIIILTFTPFICYFAKSGHINPIPYLFAEFVAANTWSMMLIIGNPTNVYLATANDINFVRYVSQMAIPTIMSGIVAFFVLYFIFRKMLKKPLTATAEEIIIQDKKLLWIGIIHIVLCTLLLTVSSYIGFEMWLITFGFAISLFLFVTAYHMITKKKSDTLKHCITRMPWELIPFVLSMFVIVLALDKYEITDLIANALGEQHTVFTYGITSFLCANLINNIPMSVLYSSIVPNLSESLQTSGVYAAIVGSNIGALFTPIGALAGIMWTGILKKHEVRFTFLSFIRYGVLVSIPTLLCALVGLWLLL